MVDGVACITEGKVIQATPPPTVVEQRLPDLIDSPSRVSSIKGTLRQYGGDLRNPGNSLHLSCGSLGCRTWKAFRQYQTRGMVSREKCPALPSTPFVEETASVSVPVALPAGWDLHLLEVYYR